MSDTTTSLAIERPDLVATAALLARVIDDAATSESIRDEARKVFDDCSFWLLYGMPGKLSSTPVALVPVGFNWPGFYGQLVAEFLLDLDPAVREANPLLVTMAETAAELVDYQGYSTDARLDGLDALNDVLASLQAGSDETP
jgi:hypothetical protein